MKKYIDVAVLEERIKQDMWAQEAKDLMGYINELPTADVVPTEFHDKCMEIEIEKRMNMEEVVRCKDCKHSKPSGYPQAVECTVMSKAVREWFGDNSCPENKDETCPAMNLFATVFENHYCGWGEKRDETD